MFRIAIGGIHTESCTFSPLPTRLTDFTLRRGDTLLNAYPYRAKFEAEYIPTLYARALPGGSVESGAYAAIKGEFLDRLRAALPLDGLFLDMHGAMNVRGMDDAEGDWITAAREVVGEKCLISGSFDLHGNVTQREADALDMLTAFRTAPHIDYEETRERALTLLMNSLESGVRPHTLRIRVPVVLPGEKTSTEWEPGMSLYANLDDVEAGVLDQSIFVGYVWADEPRSTATILISGTDDAAMRRAGNAIAQRYWNVRDQFAFGVPTGSIDECIDWALAAPEAPVLISDSGDNPTAGGAGDTPIFLKHMIAKNVPDAVFSCIGDAAATEACYLAGVGAEVSLSLGGKLDPVASDPLPVTGRVKFLLDTPDPNERQAVVQIGGVLAIIAQRRRPFHTVPDYQRVGIEPAQHKMIVNKIGYLSPELKAIAAKAFLALSPGAVDQAIERLPFERITRPVYPLDPDMTWSPDAELSVRRLPALSGDEMRPMLDESAVQGFGFVQSLFDEYESGANRFDTAGAALMGVYDGDALIGIGGVQLDPYLKRADVGRIRHVYVLYAYRRQGVGKLLLDALVQHARGQYSLLTLRTPTAAAAAFYEAIGFSRETVIPEASHSLKL